MLDYNFWVDLFDTFQSSPDWIKALWIVSVTGFLLGVLALVLRFRLASRRLENEAGGRLAYTIVADKAGGVHIYAHEGAEVLSAQKSSEPRVLPLPVAAPPAPQNHARRI